MNDTTAAVSRFIGHMPETALPILEDALRDAAHDVFDDAIDCSNRGERSGYRVEIARWRDLNDAADYVRRCTPARAAV